MNHSLLDVVSSACDPVRLDLAVRALAANGSRLNDRVWIVLGMRGRHVSDDVRLFKTSDQQGHALELQDGNPSVCRYPIDICDEHGHGIPIIAPEINGKYYGVWLRN